MSFCLVMATSPTTVTGEQFNSMPQKSSLVDSRKISRKIKMLSYYLPLRKQFFVPFKTGHFWLM